MPKDRPTILQIIPRLDAGGAELSAVEMAAGIVQAGGRALVLTEGGRLAPRIVEAGGEVLSFPAATKNPARMLWNAQRLRGLIARERIDLIHARSRAPAWSALLAARSLGVPFVTTYHGAYAETNPAKGLYNSVMARGDVVIANSQFTADLIAARYAIPRARLKVIHRGVDSDTFDPQKISVDRVTALRKSWGVPLEQRVILQAARLTRWKGQAVLIDAVARLHAGPAQQDAIMILAGDAQGRDGYARELHGQIAEMRIQELVRVVGHVDDIAAAYFTAHVTVVASVEPEAFGRTAIEAAAMGCPVVATDIGAPPETVLSQPLVGKTESTGWLVPPGSPAELARALADSLALAPAERATMGERARRHVLANFTTAAMQRRTLAVYDRLLGTALEGRYKAGSVAERFRPEPARQP